MKKASWNGGEENEVYENKERRESDRMIMLLVKTRIKQEKEIGNQDIMVG